MTLEFTGKVWYWRGPAPFYFVTVPKEDSNAIKSVSNMASYGWGVIPVLVSIGGTRFKTSLFPKDGKYIVPIKAAVRKTEDIEIDDTVTICLEVLI